MPGLIRWEDPFTGLTSLHTQIDDMFNNIFTPGSTMTQSLSTAMDVYSEDNKLVAEVQAPGFEKDDIEVNVNEGFLEIKGEKHLKEEDKKKGRSYMLREMNSSFYRRIALPKQADGSKVEANFDNGLLKVMVPFKELPKPKKVSIQSKSAK